MKSLGNLRSMRSEDFKVWSFDLQHCHRKSTASICSIGLFEGLDETGVIHSAFLVPLTNNPQEQVSRCQATADSLSTCSTRLPGRWIWMAGLKVEMDVMLAHVGTIPMLSLMGHVFFCCFFPGKAANLHLHEIRSTCLSKRQLGYYGSASDDVGVSICNPFCTVSDTPLRYEPWKVISDH